MRPTKKNGRPMQSARALNSLRANAAFPGAVPESMRINTYSEASLNTYSEASRDAARALAPVYDWFTGASTLSI